MEKLTGNNVKPTNPNNEKIVDEIVEKAMLLSGETQTLLRFSLRFQRLREMDLPSDLDTPVTAVRLQSALWEMESLLLNMSVPMRILTSIWKGLFKTTLMDQDQPTQLDFFDLIDK